MFTVSVIIPVFNAEKHLKKAVNSALSQPEVKEVILIEDFSKDNTYSICKELDTLEKRVILIQNKLGENLGAGPSRNLGIENASGKFIAFLDADDEYASDRFKTCLPFLLTNTSIDAVHEIVGVKYYDKFSKDKHLKRMILSKRNITQPILPIDYTGIEKIIAPKDLFFHLLKTDVGWIHLNALTIRAKSLHNFKLFNQNRLGQDSEFITRLSCEKDIIGTNSNMPVAIRGVHENNRITNQQSQDKNSNDISWKYWLTYSLSQNAPLSIILYLLLRISDSNFAAIKMVNLMKALFDWRIVKYGVKRILRIKPIRDNIT